jgi:hypothetical protein
VISYHPVNTCENPKLNDQIRNNPKIQSRKSKTSYKPHADRALGHLPPPTNWKLNAPLTNSSVASSGSNGKNGNRLTNNTERKARISLCQILNNVENQISKMPNESESLPAGTPRLAPIPLFVSSGTP